MATTLPRRTADAALSTASGFGCSRSISIRSVATVASAYHTHQSEMCQTGGAEPGMRRRFLGGSNGSCDFLLDLGYAVRTLRLNPGLATVAIVTLARGIGGTTAVFSVLDPVPLRP